MPTINLLVASYLENEHVERIQAVDARLHISYDPDLIPPPRYAADHIGGPFARTRTQEAQWKTWLEHAEILFDFDRTHQADLPSLAPNVRWIQATSAGIGQFVRRNEYHTRMPRTQFTTASGVHAKPLAEFCMMSMLSFSRGLLGTIDNQTRKHWERFAGTDLDGRTLLIVGLGSIGTALAQVAATFGMHTIGIKRNPGRTDPASLGVHELFGPASLHQLLPRAEFLVLITPHTDETESLIGPDELAALPERAFVINIGRGALLDEDALVNALQSGHLGGASLDVFRTEPLPTDSPLWTMPNVIVCPHSGATSDRENTRLTDLFCENIERYLTGKSLRNVLDTDKFY